MSDTASRTVEERREQTCAVLLFDASGAVLQADEVAARLLRRNADDICGRNVTDLFSGLVREHETLESLVSAQVVRSCRVVLGGGSVLAVEVQLRRWAGGKGAPFLLLFQATRDFEPIEAQAAVDESGTFDEYATIKNARLEDAAHLANLGYFELRLHGPPDVEWSPETACIMGLSPTRTSLLLSDVRRLIHPEDHARLYQQLANGVAPKGPTRDEFRVIRPDGDVRWVQVILRAVFSKDGEVEKYFGVLQDITEDRRTRHELERNQIQFQTIFELAQDGIAVFDIDANILMANPRFEELFAAGKGTTLGRTVYDLVQPASADKIRQRFAARLRGEFVEPLLEIVLRDGRRRTVRTSLSHSFHGTSSAPWGIVFATDLTEVVEARRALELTMARLQRALELTNTLVSDQDVDLRFVRMYNGRFFSNTIGKRDDELFPPEYAEPIMRLKQSVIDTGKSARSDVVVVDHGIKTYFDLCVDPVLDPQNRVIGITCVAVDITNRVQAQEARQELNARMLAELEAKNQALEVARVEADQANIAKSRFLAMMSHEIRTPLNGVLGMTGVLLDMLQDSAQREIVETIRTSGDALLTIINDILDFSKIEAGLMELEEHRFAIRDCLDDVIDLIGPQARKKFIELAFLVHPEVPEGITGDITRLRQVLVNLVGNAMKFTDAGEVVVDVELAEPAGAGRVILHFAVRDTGIGIAAERMDRLFHTFSQVDVSVNRKYGGTGLGLAICKRLVELMGGKIWVESTPGVGTTFHFTISALPAPHVTQDSSDAMWSTRRDLEGKRILVVDDNETTRRVLADQIRALGPTPVLAANAREAFQLLKAHQNRNEWGPDAGFLLALIDLEMPDIRGSQLLSTIREDNRLADLPVILLTASDASPAAIKKELLATCLSKPVKQATLFEVVVRVLLNSPQLSSRGPRSIPIDSSLGLRHPLRILLAEDNVINQKVALLLLERAGYRADVAANGREVLDAVAARAYDIILMDVQMPEMDGIEATRRLRGPGPWLGKPRIVAMTANVMQEGREACIAAGMDDFVAKPIRIPELMRTLERTKPGNTVEPRREDAWMAGTEVQLDTAEEVVVDQSAFDALRSVCNLEGEGTLESLVSEFIEDSRRILREMASMLAKGDMSTMVRLAHTLKGTSGAFGSIGFSRQMESIERACREQNYQNLNASLEVAAAEHARLARALESLCAKPVTSE